MEVADLVVMEILHELLEGHEKFAVFLQTVVQLLLELVRPVFIVVAPSALPFSLPPRVSKLNDSLVSRARFLSIFE